jgi:hypothetical protein
MPDPNKTYRPLKLQGGVSNIRKGNPSDPADVAEFASMDNIPGYKIDIANSEVGDKVGGKIYQPRYIKVKTSTSTPTTPPAAPAKPAAPASGSGMKVVTVTIKKGDNPNASRGAKLLVPNGVFVPKVVSEKDFDRTYKRYETEYMKQEPGYYKNSIPNS